MKNFVSFRIIALAFIAGFITQVTCADASVSFIGVAAGGATTDDVTVWTRATDDSNQSTQINVQITTYPLVVNSGRCQLHRKRESRHDVFV